ncbi:TrmH family RNA methyltransferase [Thomasclavelia spiroformis]|uniref:TrmH family RNA methyltransferase n=1 Tax=Thomasclavelia spiroformis TaxID=29348 RepID=UPI0039911480
MKIKAYHKNFEYTYTLGVFETIELLKNKPELVLRVYIKSNSYKNKGIEIIENLCKRNKIDLIESDNTINKLSRKDNCFAIAIIKKYDTELKNTNHVVLVNPGDMGNMGTIIRTMLGFGYNDLAIIRPGVDVFDPKVVRASMGAIFNINFEYFDAFDDYLHKYPNRDIYSLMLKGAKNIHSIEPNEKNHSLVFGNESSGLPDEFLNYGQSIFIPHSDKIDSLNLSMALGITLYHFSKDIFKSKQVLR